MNLKTIREAAAALDINEAVIRRAAKRETELSGQQMRMEGTR